MSKYINKDVIVAEIERIKKEECPIDTYEGRCKLLWFEQFLSFLDTLDVKEVDLEKEYDRYYEQERNIQTFKLAKHFFELGLNSQRKISYVLNIDDSLKELGIDPSSKEAKIFKESYYTALEKLKAQKGE